MHSKLSSVMDLAGSVSKSTNGEESQAEFCPHCYPGTDFPPGLYRRTICTLRWPLWFMMDRSEAPTIAALVKISWSMAVRQPASRRVICSTSL